MEHSENQFFRHMGNAMFLPRAFQVGLEQFEPKPRDASLTPDHSPVSHWQLHLVEGQVGFRLRLRLSVQLLAKCPDQRPLPPDPARPA